MAKIKICGLRRAEDVDYVNILKPDYIGFILSSGFRRSIDRDTAKLLKARLDDSIRVVGVFVNEDKEYIDYFLSNGIIDIVQLHGAESAELAKSIDAPVIKYFNESTFDRIKEYDVDYYLFDSGTGTGKAFDWSKIPKTDKQFFLAGGIDASNINDAINTVNPYCIDLSSSVETDGYKDFDKIKQIMEIVR